MQTTATQITSTQMSIENDITQIIILHSLIFLFSFIKSLIVQKRNNPPPPKDKLRMSDGCDFI